MVHEKTNDKGVCKLCLTWVMRRLDLNTIQEVDGDLKFTGLNTGYFTRRARRAARATRSAAASCVSAPRHGYRGCSVIQPAVGGGAKTRIQISKTLLICTEDLLVKCDSVVNLTPRTPKVRISVILLTV